MKPRYIFTLLPITFGLALVFIWLLAIQHDSASAATLTVCPTAGSGCQYTSIQAAVDAASDGDVIKIATGTYSLINNKGGHNQVVYIDKSITIRGGYTTSFTEPPNPAAHPVTLDAQGNGRVFYLTGSYVDSTLVVINVTLEGLEIKGGDATGLGGYGSSDGGGGIYAYLSSLTMQKCIIDGNTASTTGEGYGGGLELLFSGATLNENTFQNNRASTAGKGSGGGLSVYNGGGYGGIVTITGNTIQNNIASLAAAGNGGGMEMGNGKASLTGNTFRENGATSATGFTGTGGGIYFGGNSTGTEVTMTGNLVEDNYGGSGGGGGGLAFSNAKATLTGNQIISNTAGMSLAGHGGGLIAYDGEIALFSNTILDNIGCNNLSPNQQICRGGGVSLNRTKASLIGNTLQRNTAMVGKATSDNVYGGGIVF